MFKLLKITALMLFLPIMLRGNVELADWMKSYGAGEPARPGKTFYAAPDGKDPNSGLARNSAFRNINYAIKQLAPGDVRINVAAGRQSDYNQVSIRKK